MGFSKIISISAGALIFFTNITPILADSVSNMNPTDALEICQDDIKDCAEVVNQYIDGIHIEQQQPEQEVVSYTNSYDPAYQTVSYTYTEEDVTEPSSMSVDDFIAAFGEYEEDVEIDTTQLEAQYQQALMNYSTALAEYETASQLIENTHEEEVEVCEEVIDDKGNVTLETRTEIQTVVETEYLGDVDTAQANLDLAKIELDNAQSALDAAQTSTLEAADVNSEPVNVDSEIEDDTVIEDQVYIKEEVTEATSGTCGKNVTWTLDDNGKLTISGTGAMTSHPWGKDVKSVVIQNGVTSIYSFAFGSCKQLKTITIPKSVSSIDNFAFYNCSSLTSVNIPNGVTTIGNCTFEGCSSLTSVTIPSSVTTIGDSTFSDCTSLKSLTLPNSVTSLGSNAFRECSSLTSINIPQGVTTIGELSFYGCSSLKSLTLPSKVKTIERGAFWGCSNLTSINIPQGVTKISEQSFCGCSSLKSLILPSKVKTIEQEAFRNCDNLTSINIPDGVTKIADRTFYGCHNLSTITLPKGLTSIGSEAFNNCSRLEHISLPDGLTSIGSEAFSSCSGLLRLIIPDSLKTIGDEAFYFCLGLNNITLPNTVTNIGKDAFKYCDYLKDVYYQGTKNDWDKKKPYSFGDKVTIHYVGNPFPFKDVSKNTWYYSTAKDSYSKGLISGTSATTFSPLQTLTRAMVVTILWRMEGNPSVSFVKKFKDVSSKEWYSTAVSWAVKNNVVYGYGDGTFKPDAAVTREQVAVMLTNFSKYKKIYTAGTTKLNTYTDGSRVSTFAQVGMKWALSNGIIYGDNTGHLNPKRNATRAEGATILLRMYNWLLTHDPVRIKKRGIVSFVQWLVDNKYVNTSRDIYLISDLSNNLDRYNTNAADKNSPFNFDNVVKSINSIKESSSLRAKHNVKPLKITNYMMLIASIQSCATHEMKHLDHSRIYMVGENLAWQEDPFNAWYYKEKEVYDSGKSGETGHYLNIIDSSYVVTGFSWGFPRQSNQVFSRDNMGSEFTPDQYLNLFNQFRKSVGV